MKVLLHSVDIQLNEFLHIMLLRYA